MTRRDIARRAATVAGSSFTQADTIIAEALEVIAEAVSNGEEVQLRGFGTFSQIVRSSRIGRAVKRGEPVMIPERVMPVFKPSKTLKDRVNQTLAKPDGKR